MFNKFLTKENTSKKPKLIRDENDIILLNPGEKYNKLYSNFEVKNDPRNFWESIDKKIKFDSNEDIKLGYKNYRIIENDDIFKYKTRIYNTRNKNINKMIYKASSFNDFLNNSNKINNKLIYYNYNLNSRENNIYDRLYNYGFYIKNKIIINKLRKKDELSKSMNNIKMNSKSKNYLINKINKNKNSKIDKNKRIKQNKSFNYIKEETFKPKINKNSIKIARKIRKNKNELDKKNKSLSTSFYDEKNKIDNVNNNTSYEYINLFKYKNNLKNEKKLKKKSRQRLINLYKKGVEHYKRIQSEYSLKKKKDYKENYKTLKNNNDDFQIKYTFKSKNKKNITYEKNMKWKERVKEKMDKNRQKEVKIEISEVRKELNLPGKKYYDRLKNAIDIIYEPKEKINSYALMKKKSFSNLNDNEENKNKRDNIFKEKKKTKNKGEYKNYIKYIKYINNEGKLLSLVNIKQSLFKEKLYPGLNNFQNENTNVQKNQFLNLVKEINNNPNNNKDSKIDLLIYEVNIKSMKIEEIKNKNIYRNGSSKGFEIKNVEKFKKKQL